MGSLIVLTVVLVAVGWLVVTFLGQAGKQRCTRCGKWAAKSATVCPYCGSEDALALVRRRRERP